MKDIALYIQIAAQSITIILGVIALAGFLIHRKRFSAFVDLLTHGAINDRIQQVKGILGQIEAQNYDIKERRKELLASMGTLAGMLKSFSDSNESFKKTYDELMLIVNRQKSLSEATKRRLCAEIHALLGEHSLEAAIIIAENKNGK